MDATPNTKGMETAPSSNDVAVVPEPRKDEADPKKGKKDKVARLNSKIATMENDLKFLKGENAALEKRAQDSERERMKLKDKLAEVHAELKRVTAERDALLQKGKKKERFANKEKDQQIKRLEKKVRALATAKKCLEDNPSADVAKWQKIAKDRQGEVERLKENIGELQEELQKVTRK